MGNVPPPHIWSSYSLPRLITMGIQCSFNAYCWELYTTEFGWSPAEYGVVSWTCTGTQFFSFLILGAVFNFVINNQGSDNNKAQIQNYRLIPTKCIEIGGIFIHWLSYFLLIVLPIKWHGVNLHRVSRSAPKSQRMIKILPVLATLESIPPPACSACCNTTCCNNFAMRARSFGRWMGTKTFLIYLLSVAHGIGVSAQELCNKALLGYIYPEKKDASGNNDVNQAKRDSLDCINLSFFFASNLIIYLVFSLLKFYARNKLVLTETFFLISILFLLIGIPILIIFGIVTDVAEDSPDPLTGSGVNNPWWKLVCLTVFHGIVLFWIFSGGPLTFYVSFFVLGGHTGLMSFGVLINFIGLCGMSWIFMIVVAAVASANKHAGIKAFTEAPMWVMIVCIPCQLFTIITLYSHNWWWNKGNWFNYLLFIFAGIVNSLFVTYTNIMLASVVKAGDGKTYKWIFYGIFYAFTNVVVSIGFFFMFRAFGRDEPLINIACKCIRFNIHYNFASVYITITTVFITLNAASAIVYFTVLQ